MMAPVPADGLAVSVGFLAVIAVTAQILREINTRQCSNVSLKVIIREFIDAIEIVSSCFECGTREYNRALLVCFFVKEK